MPQVAPPWSAAAGDHESPWKGDVGSSCQAVRCCQPWASSGSPADLVTQLKELAALKEQGILTEEDFAAQKARILAS
jgi:hypothetical protein